MDKTSNNYSIKNYFLTIFKKYTVFLPLLLTFLMITVALLIDKTNLIFNIMNAKKNVGVVFATMASITLIICGIAFICKFSSKQTNISDVLVLSTLVFSLFSLIYILCTKFSALRAIPVLTVLFFSIVFFFVRLHAYFNQDKDDIIYQSRLSLYLKAINKKFTFFAPLFVAFSGITLTFYMQRQKFLGKIYHWIFDNPILTTFVIILFALVIAYYILACFSKRIKMIDLFAIISFYYGIYLLAFIVATGYGFRRTIVCAVLLVSSLIVLLLRILNYNAKIDNDVSKEVNKPSTDLTIKKYFLTFIKKFEVVFPFIIACGFAAFAMLTAKFNMFNALAWQSDMVKFVFISLYAVTAIVILGALAITILCRHSKVVGACDFLLYTLALSSLAVMVAILSIQATALMLLIFSASIVIFVYSAISIFFRIKYLVK